MPQNYILRVFFRCFFLFKSTFFKVNLPSYTKLYSGDWITVKSAFLKLYTLPFVENKKKALDIDFDESETLRSFFERKLFSLSKFTTLTFVNQVEIIINTYLQKLQVCSSHFAILFKVSLSICTYVYKPTEDHSNQCDQEPNQQSQMRMEIFNFEPEEETSEVESMLVDSSKSTSGRGRGRGKTVARGSGKGSASGKIVKRGRSKNETLLSNDYNIVHKKLKSITEDEESSDYNFVEEVSNSSQSTWSEKN